MWGVEGGGWGWWPAISYKRHFPVINDPNKAYDRGAEVGKAENTRTSFLDDSYGPKIRVRPGVGGGGGGSCHPYVRTSYAFQPKFSGKFPWMLSDFFPAATRKYFD